MTAALNNIGFGNTGSNNIGFGNTGNGNIGIGLSGDNQVGFGNSKPGSGNVGLFNSGTGNVGFFNSGTGNTGIGNSGNSNTGFFNTGSVNTGIANAGSFNTGSYNVGSTNTGSFNPGNYNTGSFNTGHTNTGMANSGNVNTGGFNTGSHNNGFIWRDDYQGPFSADYTVTIPQFPAVNLDVEHSAEYPHSRQPRRPAGLRLQSGSDPRPFRWSVVVKTWANADISAIQVPTITGTLPTITANIGDPNGSTALNIAIHSSGGPIRIPLLHIPAAPGFGNDTTSPSSGFFHSGAGGASGFGNLGANTSGLFDWEALGSSGVNNVGALSSGFANLGHTVSGLFNASSAANPFHDAGQHVGVAQHQLDLAGLFRSSRPRQTGTWAWPTSGNSAWAPEISAISTWATETWATSTSAAATSVARTSVAGTSAASTSGSATAARR